MSTTDVIVVGGGPAGSAVATLLARGGYSVSLFDRDRFPRDNLFGEFTGPGSLRILSNLGVLESVQQNTYRKLKGMIISAYGRVTAQTNFPTNGEYDQLPHHGFSLPRFVFDEILLRNAQKEGVKVIEAFTIDGLMMANNTVTGIRGCRQNGQKENYNSRIVIGAGGRNCPVANYLGLRVEDKRLCKLAIVTHFDGLKELKDYGEVFVSPPGYVVLAPLGEKLANVALVTDFKNIDDVNKDVEGFFLKSLNGIRDLKPRLSNAVRVKEINWTGPLAYQSKRYTWDGALLVGNSTGFIDPFTGEGIYLALRSAEIAAGVIDEAIKGNNLSREFLGQYDRLFNQEFHNKFRLSRLIQKFIYRPAIACYVTKSLSLDKELADTLVGVTGDIVPPEEVLSPKFLARLLLTPIFTTDQHGKVFDAPV